MTRLSVAAKAVLCIALHVGGSGFLATAATAQVCQSDSFDLVVRLAGDWEVEAEDRLGDLTFEETTGHARLIPTIEGCGMVLLYEGRRQGVEYGTVTMLVSRADGTVELAGADSVHDGLTFASGVHDGHTLTFRSERDMGSRVLRTRTTYSIQSMRSFTILRELQRSGTSPWEVTYRARYSRLPNSGL